VPSPTIKLLDVDEVADKLGCCNATVYREVKRGRLRAAKVGSRWRFRPDDVDAYLAGEDPASAGERAAWDVYVRKAAEAAPPLRPEQIAALSALFDWEPAPNGGAA
jgi:excisionase family DNA binding protein